MSIPCVSMDYMKSPLNPCSLESIPEPVTLSTPYDEDEEEKKDDDFNDTIGRAWSIIHRKSTTSATTTQRVWPVMLSCYHQAEPNGSSSKNGRMGKLDLYAIKVPNVNREKHMVLKFGSPQTVLDSSCSTTRRQKQQKQQYPHKQQRQQQYNQQQQYCGGILDGAWLPVSRNHSAWWYATAHSTGEVYVHSCRVSSDRGDDFHYDYDNNNNNNNNSDLVFDLSNPYSFDSHDTTSTWLSGGSSGSVPNDYYNNTSSDNNNNAMMNNNESANHPFRVKFMGKSERQSSSSSSSSSSTSNHKNNNNKPQPLCLSVNWDHPSHTTNNNQTAQRKVVSSYSNGRIAIHNACYLEKTDSMQLIETDSWQAHTMFTCPSEAWSACFTTTSNNDNNNFVLSGGDEGLLKFWDVRCTNRPMQIVQPFDAGITVLSPHPRKEYIVACGSYDETMMLFDVRYIPVMRSLSSQPPRVKLQQQQRRRPPPATTNSNNNNTHNTHYPKPSSSSSWSSSQRRRRRQRQRKSSLCRSGPLGGGVWRIKWHPYDDGRMLVAAMHGGCRIVQADGLAAATTSTPPTIADTENYTSWSESSGSSGSSGGDASSGNYPLSDNNGGTNIWDNHDDHPFRLALGDPPQSPCVVISAVKEFNDHESMVYGADWLTCQHPTRKGFFEAAASCSFYDKAVHVWDTVV